jgi:hypothetical protein
MGSSVGVGVSVGKTPTGKAVSVAVWDACAVSVGVSGWTVGEGVMDAGRAVSETIALTVTDGVTNICGVGVADFASGRVQAKAANRKKLIAQKTRKRFEIISSPFPLYCITILKNHLKFKPSD